MGASQGKALILTPQEKKLLRESWHDCMESRVDFSIAVFLRVFEQIDGTQPMFEQLRSMSISEVKTHPKMKAHCIRVTAIIGSVITDLDDPTVIIEMFRNVARTHYKLGNHLGDAHYTKFGEIFLSCVKDYDTNYSGKRRDAWAKAFQGVKATLVATKRELEA